MMDKLTLDISINLDRDSNFSKVVQVNQLCVYSCSTTKYERMSGSRIL